MKLRTKLQIVRKFSDKVTPNIDFTEEPKVQCDVPVVKNTVNDCK